MKKHTITDELLRELHSEADLPVREKIEKEVPGMIRVELEVGKNYKLSNGSIFNFSGKFDEEGDPIGWGISYDSIFYKSNDLGWGIQDGYQPATDEEVKSALIGEAEKRGLKVGNFKCLDDHRVWKSWKENSKIPEILFEDGKLWMGSGVAFSNGKFATPLQQKPSLSEAIAEYEKAHQKFLKILKNDNTSN